MLTRRSDDVDDASSYIAAQMQQERIAAQRRRDREMAKKMYQEGLARQSSSANGTGGPATDGFQRMMANARTAGAPSSSAEDDNSGHLKVEYPGAGQQPQLRDDRNSPAMQRAMHNVHQAQQAILQRRQIEQSRMQQHRPPPPQTPIDLSFAQAFQEAERYRLASQAGRLPGAYPGADMDWMSPGSQSPFPPGVLRSTTWNTIPGMGSGSTMHDIINRTSAFSTYGNLPGFGVPPMSDRMANFLDLTGGDEKMTEQELEELLKNIRPDEEIPLDERCASVEGLKMDIYHHQQLALKWMQGMEDGTNKGGILADDMGLGKTISTLALMLTRKATTRPKTNLIIGPLSLIRQWEEEIRTKTSPSHRLSVFVYHNKKATPDDLLTYDVVLTTYGTIAAELKRLEKFAAENKDRMVDYGERAIATKFPLLHPTKARFHRIILDEAQCIKNKETQTAKACHRLRAKYRWCLTGTPMMNGVLELFSLLAFLHIKPYCAWERFRQTFGVLFGKKGDEKNDAMKKLRVLLKAIMLRRKKDSQLDGKPILVLPKKSEHVVYAELSPDERDYYNQLELKAQVQFSKYLREGSIGKNYSNILVLLLRLRQACCHPHLNLDVTDTTPVTPEQVVELIKQLKPGIVARIKAADGFECPICYDAVPSPAFFIPCGHDSCNQCLSRITDNAASMNLQEGNESDAAKCPVCRGSFDPRQCFTYEAFQKVHMPEALKEESDDEDESDDESDADVIEETDASEDALQSDEEVDKKGNLSGFVVDDDHFFSDSEGETERKPKVKAESGVKAEPSQVRIKPESSDEDKEKLRKAKIKQGKQAQSPKKTKKTKKKKNGTKKTNKEMGAKVIKTDIKPSMLKELRQQARKSREAYRKYMNYLRQNWLPAAKVTECIRLLRDAQDRGFKTIVFSQWTLLLDLIEVGLEHEEGYENTPKRYDGGMTGEERNAVAKAFQDPSRKDVTVMLVSLRAGNAGLNLTQASRVIIMDPFWNPYIEMQAVDRAHRIGQQNEVEVYRILTKETVEDRIVDLKEQKQRIVEAALDESESAKIGRLGVSELKFLFNRRDG